METLEHGFRHHGVATPVSNHRGTVATVDGEGRNVVLVWLFDHRGGYAILVVDAETGASEEIPAPFPYHGDCPYASILSSRNRFYTHYANHFVEFDPATRSFSFIRETAPQMAMSMTEDDAGRIWSATYPSSGLACFDPDSRMLTDYGHVYAQDWRQYPRSVACDDSGWVYFGIGFTASQIISFDPRGGNARPLLEERARGKGAAFVERDRDGGVYAVPVEGSDDSWIELSGGEARTIGRREARDPKAYISGSQGLFHREFPDGSRLLRCDLVDRVLEAVPAGASEGDARRMSFDYTSEGAHVMGVAAAPDGTIAGGTAFPMRFFSYHPKKDRWVNRECFGQWNTVARQGDRFFVGAYSGGFLLEWDPASPWVPTEKGKPDANPAYHLDCEPDINRPHALLAHPDGNTVIMTGTPGYGYTGGGVLIWERREKRSTLLPHSRILTDHSTMSLVALEDGNVMGGTTVAAGTGGAEKASEAELYLLDLASREVVWHVPAVPGARSYPDLLALPGGSVLGTADRTTLFVFNLDRRLVTDRIDTPSVAGSVVSQQGPRVFHRDSDGTIYALLAGGIARITVDPLRAELLAESPVPIQAGGDIFDGRLYFASGSHLYSWEIPSRE